MVRCPLQLQLPERRVRLGGMVQRVLQVRMRLAMSDWIGNGHPQDCPCEPCKMRRSAWSAVAFACWEAECMTQRILVSGPEDETAKTRLFLAAEGAEYWGAKAVARTLGKAEP